MENSMTKEAMISPDEVMSYQNGWDESVYPPVPTYVSGWRVAQVVDEGQTFPMAEPIFWMPCADYVVADFWYYDPATDQILQCPPNPFPPPSSV